MAFLLCTLCQECDDNLEEEVDVEGEGGGDDFEEYTWAGQTRVRATSMLQGGVSGEYLCLHQYLVTELGSGSVPLDTCLLP